MPGNPNFDVLLTTTLNKYRKQLADNVSSQLFLLWWLREKGRIEPVDGGVKIVEPLLYATGQARSYHPNEELQASVIGGITAAEYNWKFVYTDIAIPVADELKNRGSSRIISILKAKIEQAEIAMAEKMNEIFFGDGLGNDGLDMLGLQAIVSTNPTSGVLGGIDRTTNTWWRNQTLSGAQTSTPFDNLITRMRQMYIACTRGKQSPEIIITTPTVYEGYESLLQPYQRFTNNKAADAGFDNLLFKNKPIVWDDDCPSGCMYFLNSTYLKFRPHVDENFVNTPFVQPHNQRIRVSFIFVTGNLTCSNCARQGVIHSIS